MHYLFGFVQIVRSQRLRKAQGIMLKSRDSIFDQRRWVTFTVIAILVIVLNLHMIPLLTTLLISFIVIFIVIVRGVKPFELVSGEII